VKWKLKRKLGKNEIIGMKNAVKEKVKLKHFPENYERDNDEDR
jgi:hypothetical protein